MQTFLPYPCFAKSASVLDRQRLGKQRLEVTQILRALRGESKGWTNHPVVLAWRGYENALAHYGLAVCDEWVGRGYKDTRRPIIESCLEDGHSTCPPWFGVPALHSAYRRRLLRKDPQHYGQFGWEELPAESDDFDYGLFGQGSSI
jgi:hypothetical protein